MQVSCGYSCQGAIAENNGVKLCVHVLDKVYSLQFTLYFHQVLAEHASVYDMKHLAAKLDTDYILE